MSIQNEPTPRSFVPHVPGAMYNAMLVRAELAEAWNERLVEALRGFADGARMFDHYTDEMIEGVYPHPQIPVADYRAARAVLVEYENTKGERNAND